MADTQRPELLINPRMAWAVHTADQGHITYLPHLDPMDTKLPQLHARLTLPFLVDSVTRKPITVRVVELSKITKPGHDLMAVVVARDH